MNSVQTHTHTHTHLAAHISLLPLPLRLPRTDEMMRRRSGGAPPLRNHPSRHLINHPSSSVSLTAYLPATFQAAAVGIIKKKKEQTIRIVHTEQRHLVHNISCPRRISFLCLSRGITGPKPILIVQPNPRFAVLHDSGPPGLPPIIPLPEKFIPLLHSHSSHSHAAREASLP